MQLAKHQEKFYINLGTQQQLSSSIIVEKYVEQQFYEIYGYFIEIKTFIVNKNMGIMLI